VAQSATAFYTPPALPTNRMLTGVNYDLAGNMTSPSPGAVKWQYNAENMLVKQEPSSDNGANWTTTAGYAYDGDGRRVMKMTGGVTTVFVYDAAGNLAAEYASGTQPAQQTLYVTTDHLGSTRLVTSAPPVQPLARYDYLPFGEEIPADRNSRSSILGYNTALVMSQKFTGKERGDLATERSLDYFGARYLSSAQGRWISPDPTKMTWERLEDPQQFNLHGYVRNDVLSHIDDVGEEIRAVVYKNNADQNGVGFLDQDVAPAFQAFNEGLIRESGNPTYSYLFRTTVEQTAIFKDPARAKGNPVITPGTSAHESGLAFDLNTAGLARQGFSLTQLQQRIRECVTDRITFQ
jgi:RHS repeat-associated protein